MSESVSNPITEAEKLIGTARRIAASVPKSEAGQTLIALADLLTTANRALDAIALRVTDDDYDDSASALESIGNEIELTGRTIIQRDYS